jgi:hypothetical protein
MARDIAGLIRSSRVRRTLLGTTALVFVVIAVLSLFRPHEMAAGLVLGQVVGRVLSLLLDGVPSQRVWPIAILEAVGAVALLLVRPDAARTG